MLTELETAVLHTIHYMDLFDYPAAGEDIHRYLTGLAASRADVAAVLDGGRLQPDYLSRTERYYHLPGREQIATVRRQRAEIAQGLWPNAIYYGRLLTRLPFVRMVAVTGSLAMNNTPDRADIDYLVVTGNGSLWLCRAFIIGIVHLAARRQLNLCPNYLISERALTFDDQNLYTAHELTQMIPLSSLPVYQNIRQCNRWTARFLPNAAGPPPLPSPPIQPYRPLQQLLERPLAARFGSWLDRWEMERKIAKFQRQYPAGSEASFSADWCKGHFTAHQGQTITAYQQRLQE